MDREDVMPRRVHLSTVYTHQPYNRIGLDLELPNQPLKVAPKDPRIEAPRATSFRVSPGRQLGSSRSSPIGLYG